MANISEPLELRQFTNRVWRAEKGPVPAEMPVTLTVNGETWLEFMCTPEHLDALAVGFLYNEGLIDGIKEIAQIRICPAEDNVDVWTSRGIRKPAAWRRTSGCTGGVTSAGAEMKAHAVELPIKPRRPVEGFDEITLTPDQVNELVLQLFKSQTLHRQSGGVHASALSDGQQVFLSCEDIGRHNTLDKLAGRVLLERIETPRLVVLTTGRISSEMMQKAVRIGTVAVISCTAPTTLAVRMAEEWNVTLIGYARRERFTVYTHPRRIMSN